MTVVRFVTGLAWVLMLFGLLIFFGAMNDANPNHRAVVFYRWTACVFILSVAWLVSKYCVEKD